MLYTLKLYYHKGKLKLIGIELNAVKHLTSDIRKFAHNELLFILSNKTIEGNIFNMVDINELVERGHYVLIEKDVEVEVDSDIYTHCYIDPKFYLVDNF